MEGERQKASDHLANERTYLAWIRTSIATMGFGVVISRLKLEGHAGATFDERHLGFLFVLAGLLTIVIAASRFSTVKRSIVDDKYLPADKHIHIISGVTGLLALCVLLFLAICFRAGN